MDNKAMNDLIRQAAGRLPAGGPAGGSQASHTADELRQAERVADQLGMTLSEAFEYLTPAPAPPPPPPGNAGAGTGAPPQAPPDMNALLRAARWGHE